MRAIFVFCLLSVAFALTDYSYNNSYTLEPSKGTCTLSCCYGASCIKDKKGRESCQCPQICDKIYQPVCGSDLKNYSNACTLSVAHCLTKGAVVAIPNRFCGLPEPCNVTTNCVGGYCVGSGSSSICRQFVNEGDECNGSLPPQYSTLCKAPLLCVVRKNLVGGSGICTRQAPHVTALAILEPNDPTATTTPLVSGTVTITQAGVDQPVVVTASITGLPTGTYGFHIHATGNTTFVAGAGRCPSVGAHYNPFNMTHGLPTDAIRHVGDLGNFNSTNGVAEFTIQDKVVTLYGQYSVIGRAFVVHAMMDDGGQTGMGTSNTTGNAGARRACGVIGFA